MQDYIDATLRGYAVGVKMGDVKVDMAYFRDQDCGIDQAYAQASKYALGLRSTIQRNPALMRRQVEAMRLSYADQSN